MVELRHRPNRITRLWCDNGKGEYDNDALRSILTETGIAFEPAPPYTQHKNGVSERMIQTHNAKARAMMLDSSLPPNLWAGAINTANYLMLEAQQQQTKVARRTRNYTEASQSSHTYVDSAARRIDCCQIPNGKESSRLAPRLFTCSVVCMTALRSGVSGMPSGRR